MNSMSPYRAKGLLALLCLHLCPVFVRPLVVRRRILRKHHVGLLIPLKEKLAVDQDLGDFTLQALIVRSGAVALDFDEPPGRRSFRELVE